MQNSNVYIQAMSACCSAGLSLDEVFDSILNAKSGIKKHKDILIDGELCSIGKIDSTHSFDKLMIEQTQNILDNSKLNDFHNTFLLVGTSVGGMTWAEDKFIENNGSYKNIKLDKQSIYSVSHTLNKKFDFRDTITFSTACTSSSNAVVFAKELLEEGACESVLVVGADSISYTTVNGFNALGVLSKKCATPFDIDRSGMNVAEGIGTILFSTTKSNVLLAGVGCSSDAYNITHPEPNGAGTKKAMQQALDDANITAIEINYINAHGTGTGANDTSEGKAINELFSHKPYVGSTKSITGHTLGACGVIELIISALSMKRGVVPANFNLNKKELDSLNLPTQNIETELNYILSNSFAFGGNNVSIILKREVNEN